MKIVIEIIDHLSQEYETVGNYKILDSGDWWIGISDFKRENINYEIAVALHELHELALCQEFKIKCADIDKFDINFEELRKKNPDIIGVQEPGDMVSAPYYHQHQTATVIEKLHIKESGENWHEYTDACNAMDNGNN